MILVGILILICTFLAMEGVAWLTHKYVMHGLFWFLHKDHHVPSTESVLEKNDYFFVIFAAPGIFFTVLGSINELNYLFFIGLGITVYGFVYFLIHEIFIHQRLKWFRNSNSKYLRAIRRAHKVHHKHLGKHDGECFGMLLVPFKYFKAELKK
jgi:beta-carotene 3-hydroxylase